MNEVRLTRTFLEGLTTTELTALADSRGIDIPPGLERIFIIAELLEAASDFYSPLEEDSLPNDDSALPLAEADFLESVPLPRQYNITYIDVFIRDPLWVFAFWEIKGVDKEMHESAPDFGGYYLKVSPAEGEGKSPAAGYSFTVPVGTTDTAWYLGFSHSDNAESGSCPGPCGSALLRVELGVLRGEETVSLAVSRSFRLPSLFPAAGEYDGRNPLALLSGLDELPVLRNADRLSRTLKPQARI
ncbi:hypothetical protein AGMMS49991_03850 [Spirochaetia bacterium]|nr:hypothetical protein AGMMS49991_03850 [Spirochaetia bacterium]